jgi:hypothetical protein
MSDERQAIAELLQQIFLMVRAVTPTTQDNTQRQTEFATRLQAYLESRDQ